MEFENLPVTVPTDFLGMNWMRWPVAGTNPTTILDWGMIRLGQIPEMWWATIETSAGVYSATALANLDAIVSYHRGRGVSVRMGLYYVPVFYTSAAAHPTYADNVTKGPWAAFGAYASAYGECANPTSLTAVANFVSMLVTRYNLPGGAWYDANFATLGKGIDNWEPWTEPRMSPTGGNGNTTGVGGNGTAGEFWWGTDKEQVDLCATQYDVIKALDPSISVSSPSFFSGQGMGRDIEPFFATTGPVTGKTGLQVSDTFAWHPYQHGQPGHDYHAWSMDIQSGRQGVKTIRNWLASKGYPDFDLWLDEWGWDTTTASATAQLWHNAEASVRYTMMARFLMSCAALGIKCVHPWHWEYPTPLTGPSGNWINDLTGVTLAYNDFAAKVSGKTITSGTYVMNGEVSLHFSDGTSWTV